jgi:predicted acyl esterase
MFMPAGSGRFPALIESSPYRGHDVTRQRDSETHGRFALHGYASLRVDTMGTGDSDGVLTDEYQKQEIRDLEDAIAYVASQPWCSGSVGVFGHSWGAYSAMLVAMQRPPALKAIIPVMGSCDRYAECVHYNGGCLLSSNLVWASFMQIYAALPPDPARVGAKWLDIWIERLAAQPLWAREWMRHPGNDAYWMQGSVAPNYGSIKCPVYVFSGTADRYTDFGFHLLSNCKSFVKLTMGPWEHCYPHEASVEPIDFPGEAVRWWDRWLKLEENGIDTEPKVSVWITDPSAEGLWVRDDRPPSETTTPFVVSLASETHSRNLLKTTSGDIDWVVHPASGTSQLPLLDVPVMAWSAVVDRDLHLLGKPLFDFPTDTELDGRQLIARLFIVDQDGVSTEISRGSRRYEDRRVCDVANHRIELSLVARRVPAKSRILLFLFESLWPSIAPLYPARSDEFRSSGPRLILPVRSSTEDAGKPFAPARKADTSNLDVLLPARRTISISRNDRAEHLIATSANAGFFGDFTRARLADTDTEIEHTFDTEFKLDERGQANISKVTQSFRIERGSWQIALTGSFSLSSTSATHVLSGDIQAHMGGVQVFGKIWPPHTLDAENSRSDVRRR